MESERKIGLESDVIPAKVGIYKDVDVDPPVKPGDYKSEKDELDPRHGGDDNTKTAADLRPEYCQYSDEGCDLAESCLNCPFKKCLYEEWGGRQRWLKRKRAKDIARLHTVEGKSLKELAGIFGVSQRTVQRALKNVSPSPSLSHQGRGNKKSVPTSLFKTEEERKT